MAAKSETRQGLPNKLWNEQVPVGGLYSIDGPVLLLNGLPLYLFPAFLVVSSSQNFLGACL